MNKRRELPSRSELRRIFVYEEMTGHLIWKSRPRKEFAKDWVCRSWNTKYAGKVAGCRVPKDEIIIHLSGINYAAHRLIYKMKTGLEPSHIDHKNLNPEDNRFDNLRPANDMKNGWNAAGHKNTVSGLKGVYFNNRCKNKPWVASVYKGGICYRGGYHHTKEEAFATACELRNKLHGDFARHGAN